MRCLGITSPQLILSGRPQLPGNPTELAEKPQEYPTVMNPGLPVPCHCSPGAESRSPHSFRSSPSPSQLSPGGPDDLSMAKSSHNVDKFEINKSLTPDSSRGVGTQL
nr:uncharacterized protein LOC111516491 [Leptinotarsa decemlineata]